MCSSRSRATLSCPVMTRYASQEHPILFHVRKLWRIPMSKQQKRSIFSLCGSICAGSIVTSSSVKAWVTMMCNLEQSPIPGAQNLYSRFPVAVNVGLLIRAAGYCTLGNRKRRQHQRLSEQRSREHDDYTILLYSNIPRIILSTSLFPRDSNVSGPVPLLW
jgi:hypothetical protein